jgi:hypothetical protein
MNAEATAPSYFFLGTRSTAQISAASVLLGLRNQCTVSAFSAHRAGNVSANECGGEMRLPALFVGFIAAWDALPLMTTGGLVGTYPRVHATLIHGLDQYIPGHLRLIRSETRGRASISV